MAPFKKKKKNIPTLYKLLDQKLEETKNSGDNKFYYSLHTNEESLAHAWAVAHRLWVTLSHQNDEGIVYEFSGF